MGVHNEIEFNKSSDKDKLRIHGISKKGHLTVFKWLWDMRWILKDEYKFFKTIRWRKREHPMQAQAEDNTKNT